MCELYGVIGDPIVHSMSPVMHNAAFKKAVINASYGKFHVTPDALPQAINGIRALGLRGINVTVPHKTAVIPLLDEVDPLAQSIGAVNTIVNREGKLIGFNTDGLGFVEGLKKEISGSISNKSVLIIGAGGAAKAIYHTLAALGVKKVDLANRSEEKAAAMIGTCPAGVESHYHRLDEAGSVLHLYDIVIQTTSIGMYPRVGESPVRIERVKPGAVFSDIIYNPLKTTFLKQAEEKGAIIQNGIDMFVHQGALAFNKWTGVTPDTELLKKVVLKQLGGTQC
ncbi:shikimate dehydrogenase [Rossellomorea aquimaris]|uniref:Shikimate dehydrogenase (NADP(+)) n=1 Tax=Rossellomorea aquimaris TaxID=189382 RepID=A0A1J6WXL9_9BACI|nr:shikimate dehydrogenase [Rossellomorea aquimaris]OIU70633.1 shikimate dehydrogenase [Rossellomorea aquimaris]